MSYSYDKKIYKTTSLVNVSTPQKYLNKIKLHLKNGCVAHNVYELKFEICPLCFLT